VRHLALLFTVFLAISGCTAVKQYKGPERPLSELSILVKDKVSAAVINNIDGKFRGIGILNDTNFCLVCTHSWPTIFNHHRRAT